MKINLPEEKKKAIEDSLNERNVASFEYNGKTFYARLDRVSFKERDSIINHTIQLQEAFSAVIKDAMSKVNPHNVFTTFARSTFNEVFETGKLITVYFSSNDRLDTPFPNELISRNDCEVQIEMNHKYK